MLHIGPAGIEDAWLNPAREAVSRLASQGEISPYRLELLPAPGFEGRPAAPNLEAMLDALDALIAEALEARRDGGFGGALLVGLGARIASALCAAVFTITPCATRFSRQPVAIRSSWR